MINKQAKTILKPPAKQQQKVEYLGDSPEYGSLVEMSAMTKVFVEADDVHARNIILHALEKYLGLQVVESKDESDFKLVFRISQQTTGVSWFGSGVVTDKNINGEMFAVTRGSVDSDGKGHIRILWSIKKVQFWSGVMTLNKHPASSAIGRFIKDLKKLRREK